MAQRIFGRKAVDCAIEQICNVLAGWGYHRGYGIHRAIAALGHAFVACSHCQRGVACQYVLLSCGRPPPRLPGVHRVLNLHYRRPDFHVAGGLRLWLDSAVPAAAVIENPPEMFAGWYWDDSEGETDWSSAETDQTPRQLLAERVAASCSGDEVLTVLRYRDGALEAYLWTIGYSGFWETPAQRLLLMLAGAGAFKDDGADDYVIFWEDVAGMLPERNEDALLALLAVGKRRVRFVGKRPLTDILTGLRPAYEAFTNLAYRLDEDVDTDDPQDSTIPLDPSYIDAAILSGP